MFNRKIACAVHSSNQSWDASLMAFNGLFPDISSNQRSKCSAIHDLRKTHFLKIAPTLSPFLPRPCSLMKWKSWSGTTGFLYFWRETVALLLFISLKRKQTAEQINANLNFYFYRSSSIKRSLECAGGDTAAFRSRWKASGHIFKPLGWFCQRSR